MNKDPYSVLGVSHTATDEEIKKAYRDLARKYHPDNYHDNPLSDLAQEKMKEVNEAYDAITKNRTGGGDSYSSDQRSGAYQGYGGGYGNANTSSGSPEFVPVRQAINAGNIDKAEQLLNSLQTRNAEWNFLMGSVCYRRGWLDDARSYYQRAVSMDPGNAEYRQALNYMATSGQAYRPQGYGQQGGIDACDICTMMMCADMCCRCG